MATAARGARGLRTERRAPRGIGCARRDRCRQGAGCTVTAVVVGFLVAVAAVLLWPRSPFRGFGVDPDRMFGADPAARRPGLENQSSLHQSRARLSSHRRRAETE